MIRLTIPRSLTHQAAQIIAKHLAPGDVIGLIGPLGVGKTTIVQYILKALHSQTKVTSPTFTLLQTYTAQLHKKKIHVHHIDLYRIENPEELRALGLSEWLNAPDTISFIEWADKFPHSLPARTIFITLDPT